MSFVRMALTNYRCFAARQEIELRPVTVVLGRNNSAGIGRIRSGWMEERYEQFRAAAA
ncbi:MAG: hypothetical protein JXA67_11210 [Micromonosporaceae bacterium]|nr:hypothetical protein [Micromonosporaceae bacterium]